MRAASITVLALAAGSAVAACKVEAKQVELGDAAVGDAAPDAPISPGGPIETFIDQSPPDFSNQPQAMFAFHSNIATATFECRFDMEPGEPCVSPDIRTLPDGTHVFSVRAMDGSGDDDATPAERAWTIDTVPPDTMLLTAPPPADNSVTAQFTFTSNEMNVMFTCSIDGAGELPCKSGDSFGPLGDGEHVFSVRARDRAGNVDPTPATYAWTIDTSTPDTQIVSGPSGAVASTTAAFTFISPDAGGGATFQCSLDGAAFAACTSPVTYSGLAEKQHVFEVRVRDSVGNVDPTPATRAWTVDLTPPATTIISGPTGTVANASAIFTFTSNEQNVTFACSLDGAPAAACTSPQAYTGLAQGAHVFSVTATDAAGNVDPTPATRTWSVDTVPPALAITGGPATGSSSGPHVAFTFTVSDGTVTCSFDGAPATPCASPVAVNLPAGPHTFKISATDSVGNTDSATRSWTVACSAPDTTGAAGLLHLDDTGQTLANAVAGGAPATLGDTTMVEPSDPSEIAAGRFGGAVSFTAANAEHVAWPIALAAMPAFTIELWARPDASAGAHALLASGDGRIAISATATSPSAVTVSIAVVGQGMAGKTYTATSAPVAAGQWHHVLASLEDPALRLWVDGVRTEVDMVTAGAAPALDSIQLGGTYTGDLDEVWLAQTAITSDADALARYCPAD